MGIHEGNFKNSADIVHGHHEKCNGILLELNQLSPVSTWNGSQAIRNPSLGGAVVYHSGRSPELILGSLKIYRVGDGRKHIRTTIGVHTFLYGGHASDRSFALDVNYICSYLAMTKYERKNIEQMTRCKRRVLMPRISFASTAAELWRLLPHSKSILIRGYPPRKTSQKPRVIQTCRKR